jgi:hypothetical protein
VRGRRKVTKKEGKGSSKIGTSKYVEKLKKGTVTAGGAVDILLAFRSVYDYLVSTTVCRL